VALGAVFSLRLFLFFSGVAAAVAAGLAETEGLGTGEIVSLRLFLSLGERRALAGVGLVDNGGAVEAGPLVAAVALGAVAAAGLCAALSDACTVGGGTDFGSSFFIFSFNSVCAF
jgi:hypothetical protein